MFLNITHEQDTVNATCLLYTSDAADERSSVDLGGRRIINKKKQQKKNKKRKNKKSKVAPRKENMQAHPGRRVPHSNIVRIHIKHAVITYKDEKATQ